MSVQSEIERITNNVQTTLSTIAETGVAVGEGSDALPAAAAALANEKQNKLTGAKGKIVGYGDTGLAEAQFLTDITNYPATSTNGIIYTATVPWITELTAGVGFVMIPDTTSTATSVKLNVSGTGEKFLRRPLTTNSSASTGGNIDSWIVAGKPIVVMYDGTYWKTLSIPAPDANTIYGTLGIENGGTGAVTAEAARANLGIESIQQLTSLPASGTTLTANAEYRVSETVGTYQFAFPASGDVYVRFTTAATYAISFASGTRFLGAAPEFVASTTYELMARDGVVAVGEVVTA